MADTAGYEAASPVSPISPVSPVFDKHSSKIKRNASTKQLKLMNGPLYQQGHNNVNVVLVRRVRRKDDSAWKMLSRWMVENQVGMSASLSASFAPNYPTHAPDLESLPEQPYVPRQTIASRHCLHV